MILSTRRLKNEKIKGSKNSTTSIPAFNHIMAGSSNETVLGPVGYLAANNKAVIANIKVINTIENLFTITNTPF